MGSSSEERGRLEELGSEVAQLRERMSEVDRAVTALTNTGIYEHINVTEDTSKFLLVSLPLIFLLIKTHHHQYTLCHCIIWYFML